MKSKNVVIMMSAIVSLSSVIIFNFNTSYQQLDGSLINLSIMPATIESTKGVLPIGYIQILKSDGTPQSLTNEIEIQLESSNTSVATVPEKIVIPANQDFTNFDITIVNDGETEISANLQNKIVAQRLIVGGTPPIPSDVTLAINLPTESMNVNSEMPISVSLYRNGTAWKASRDLNISVDYEKTMLQPEDEIITIKRGDSYGLTTVKSLEKTGNAFLKVQSDQIGFTNATKIEIRYAAPAGLIINIFPNMLAYTEKKIDAFVGLVDSSGSPTVAAEDTMFSFFSNSTDLENSIEKALKPKGPIIKKGQFGFHLQHKFIFPSGKARADSIIIGASAPDLGITNGTLKIVEPLSADDEKAKSKAVKIFTPSKMPGDTSSIVVYQIYAIEKDEDDRTKEIQDEIAVAEGEVADAQVTLEDAQDDLDQTEEDVVAASSPGGTSITSSEQDDIDDAERAVENAQISLDAAEKRLDYLNTLLNSEDINEHEIDDLKAGELYPVQTNLVYSSNELVGNLKVISGDNTLAKIVSTGEILTTSSYGVAAISSSQKAGTVKLSAILGGLGSASNSTTVADPLQATETKIFSPSGSNIVFDDEGHHELYFILLDSTGNPTKTKDKIRFLVQPSNEFLDINSQQSYAKMVVSSSELGGLTVNNAKISATPIGIAAPVSLESTSTFNLVRSVSTVKVSTPFENILQGSTPKGVVQLLDPTGAPLVASEDLRITLVSNNTEVIQVPNLLTIPAGTSFTDFPITTSSALGNSYVFVTSENFASSETKITVSMSSNIMNIFIKPDVVPVGLNQDTQVKIFTDTLTGQPLADVSLQLSAKNGVVTPTSILTGSDGKATVTFKATAGPTASLIVQASKAGILDAQKTKELEVSGTQVTATSEFLGIPSWALYAGVAGAVGAIGFAAYMFLKKPKEIMTEEEEEEI